MEAKGATYDGDDWGEYDEIDEYGVEQDQQEPIPQVPQLPQPQQKVTGLRHAGQSAGGPSAGGRNFTSPEDAPIPGVHRQQSFDVGDERQAFSAGAPHPAAAGQLPDIPQGAPLHVQTDVPSAMRQRADTSSSHYPSAGGISSSTENTPYSADPTHQRDFSPSAMPPPLRSTPGPSSPQTAIDTSSPSTNPPPRKSSLSQPNSPLATALQALPEEEVTPRQRAPSNPQKPLPFIRPADIYKRMEEERARERASQESSRPSLDSILRPQDEARLGTPSKKSSSESLPSVQEEGRSGTPASQKKPMLPTVAEGQPAVPTAQPTFSEAGRALDASQTSTSFYPGLQTDLQHQPSSGFRSVVHQAFDRPDGEKSMPETPLSAQNSLRSPGQSDMSRSNTDSTAGISPIMSRVPSVGAVAEGRINNSYLTSYDHSSTPVIAEEPSDSSRPSSLQKPPPTSIPRKPSPSHSREPSAESPFIPGYRRQDTPPSRGSPARTPGLEQSRRTPEPQSAQLDAEPPVAEYSVREADLTNAGNSRPGTGRVESPAKRNSVHSISSRQSWEEESPGKEDMEQPEQRPPAHTEPSFRPKLPGQWESFATTQADRETVPTPDVASDSAPAPSHAGGFLPADKAAETDLKPTTATRQLQSDEVHQQAPSLMQDPVAALSAAGAAIGESIKSSVGMNTDTTAQEAEGDRSIPDEPTRGPGDIYTRPGALRMQSAVSNASTIPPTPPPKDVDPIGQSAGITSYANEHNSKPSVPLKTWDSNDSGFDDDENDRLRRDIVRSLSPDKDHPAGLSVPEGTPGNRESNVLPSEYGDYWEGATPDGTRYSRMPGETHVGPQGVELTRPAHIAEEPSPATTETPQRPGFLDQRFSWEKNQDSPGFGDLSTFGAAARTSGAPAGEVAERAEQQHDDGSNAPEVVIAPQEHVPTPSFTVDDAPKRSFERSVSPPTTGLHVVNARGAEEAVDIPPRLQTPEPQAQSHDPFEDAPSALKPTETGALDLQDPEPIDELEFSAQSDAPPTASAAPTSSLAPAAEITGPSSSGLNPRIPPFRELAAIPNPTERIKAYNATRDQFATTDTGLQGWLAQTIAAHPEHSGLLSGQQLSPLVTRTSTGAVKQVHKTSPSMSKFSNMLSPSSPQQGQNFQPNAPMQGSSPGSSQPSGDGGLSAKKGKELLQNAGAIGGALGGKVGQGAKGLFAKGRNKLRAASGSEKVE